MIRFLNIKRLAVIDTLEMELEPGLTILTGETGAGKSILIEALGLLLGERASAELVRTGESGAVVQAVFEHKDGSNTIVRREISAQGRSRGFIDDNLVTVSALRKFGAGAIDLHGQHDHQALLNSKTHIDFLDAYGDLSEKRIAVAAAFKRMRAIEAHIQESTISDQEREARISSLRFQLEEIDAINPQTSEDESLGALQQKLSHAETIVRLCHEAEQVLYEGNRAILDELSNVWKNVEELVEFEPSFGQHLQARDNIKSQLEDLVFALRDYAGSIDTSPERLQEVDDRMAALQRLKKQYGGGSFAMLLEQREHFQEELNRLDSKTARLSELQKSCDDSKRKYLRVANVLSQQRKKVGANLTVKLMKLLSELAMENTKCDFQFAASDLTEKDWSARGLDVGELYFTPNTGEALRPLAKIASGGELSRVMLALKTLASADTPGKSLIFDEVDSGIGGRVADVVGERLQELAKRFQILCVTHLPLIAAYGSVHYEISKKIVEGRTVTSARLLNNKERIDEIARMMTGRKVSERARQSARELLSDKKLLDSE
jgi:DNA repair protein RecN (Recombination protein N)